MKLPKLETKDASYTFLIPDNYSITKGHRYLKSILFL